MQLSFGSGAAWGERTDVTGSGIGPRQFGVLQDIQIDFDWSDKELYGQLQFPVAIARGQGKITGKARRQLCHQRQAFQSGDYTLGRRPVLGEFRHRRVYVLLCRRQCRGLGLVHIQYRDKRQQTDADQPAYGHYSHLQGYFLYSLQR